MTDRLMDDSIGWRELGERLGIALDEAMGVDATVEWIEEHRS